MIPELRINNISVGNVGIGDASISNVGDIYVSQPYIRNPYVMQIADADRVWMMDPSTSIPTNAPVTDRIGRPIVEMPGCVVLHKENARGWNENMQLVNDDPKGNVAVCDAGQPAFDPIDYDPANLRDTTPPPPPNEPEPDTRFEQGDPPVPPESPGSPEPPSTPTDTKEDPPCPGPNAQRIGDVAQNQTEKVSGYELQIDPKNPDGEKICVILYEDIGPVEQYLPSAQIVTTTAVIASVAASSALLAKPLADLLLRVVKPAVKQVLTKVNAILGKTPYRPTQKELKTNEYRKKKGLLGINFAKEHQKKMKAEKEREKKKEAEEKKQQGSE